MDGELGFERVLLEGTSDRLTDAPFGTLDRRREKERRRASGTRARGAIFNQPEDSGSFNAALLCSVWGHGSGLS